MKNAALIGCSVLAFVGCAHVPPRAPDPQPMPLCFENEATRAEDPALLLRARVEAQRYSNETYGEDCYVCAEWLGSWVKPEQIFLHVTSPIKNDFLNTSAAVVLRRSDGKVVERMKWHSCQARVVSREDPEGPAP